MTVATAHNVEYQQSADSEKMIRDTHAVHISDDSGNTRQTSATAGHDADVLVSVLAFLSLAVGVVVQVRDGFAKFCDSTVSGMP